MNSTTQHSPESTRLLQYLQQCEKWASGAHTEGVCEVPARQAMAARLRICGEELAVPLASVKALIRHPQVVAVPGTPSWIRGAIRVGQQMLAVIPGEWASGQHFSERHREPELAVVLDLPVRRIAVLVDAVTGLAHRNSTTLGDAPRELDLNTLTQRIEAQCRSSDCDSTEASVATAGDTPVGVGSETT